MAVLWLTVILLVIVGASRVLGASRSARFLPAGLRQAVPFGPDAPGGLTLRGTLALDLRRRVYLVEAGGQSTLILTGGTTDLMLALRQADG